jgi:hypothetical protein
MAIGYMMAAANPIRHRVWIQVGIARGALECLLGVLYLVRGTVTFQQAGLGIILAALVSIAYLALYPRKPRVASATSSPTPVVSR